MSRLKKLSHSIYGCKYHTVFCPNYRYPVFDGKTGEYTKQQVVNLARQKDVVEVEEINLKADHIHTILPVPPKYSLSGIMGFLKGKMALNLFHRYERLKKRYWGRRLWLRGDCASTIGLDEEQIRKYVRWQNHKDKQAEQLALWQMMSFCVPIATSKLPLLTSTPTNSFVSMTSYYACFAKCGLQCPCNRSG